MCSSLGSPVPVMLLNSSGSLQTSPPGCCRGVGYRGRLLPCCIVLPRILLHHSPQDSGPLCRVSHARRPSYLTGTLESLSLSSLPRVSPLLMGLNPIFPLRCMVSAPGWSLLKLHMCVTSGLLNPTWKIPGYLTLSMPTQNCVLIHNPPQKAPTPRLPLARAGPPIPSCSHVKPCPTPSWSARLLPSSQLLPFPRSLKPPS